MSEKTTRRSFDREFKISAVKLVLESGKSVKTIAAELGISDNTLFNWKKKYLSEREGFPEDAKNAFPGKGHLKPDEEELRKKDREIARLKMERDILKKAIAYFAKEKV
jgi:transposase